MSSLMKTLAVGAVLGVLVSYHAYRRDVPSQTSVVSAESKSTIVFGNVVHVESYIWTVDGHTDVPCGLAEGEVLFVQKVTDTEVESNYITIQTGSSFCPSGASIKLPIDRFENRDSYWVVH